MERIIEFLRLIGNDSLSIETDIGKSKELRDWIFEPIIKYPLAPRYARAVLLLTGHLLSKGLSIRRIIMHLSELDGRGL